MISQKLINCGNNKIRLCSTHKPLNRTGHKDHQSNNQAYFYGIIDLGFLFRNMFFKSLQTNKRSIEDTPLNLKLHKKNTACKLKIRKQIY